MLWNLECCWPLVMASGSPKRPESGGALYQDPAKFQVHVRDPLVFGNCPLVIQPSPQLSQP